MKIAIISNEKLQFPPANIGRVMMEIDLIQIIPEEQLYDLRIIDVCLSLQEEKFLVPGEITEENPRPESVEKSVKKVVELGRVVRSGKKFTFEELSQLATALNIKREDFNSEPEYINELFVQGLLLITQKECKDGISGIKGKGMYFSKANTWRVYRGEDLVELLSGEGYE